MYIAARTGITRSAIRGFDELALFRGHMRTMSIGIVTRGEPFRVSNTPRYWRRA